MVLGEAEIEVPMSLEASCYSTSVLYKCQPREIFDVRTRRHLFEVHLRRSAKLTMSRSNETYEMQASTGPSDTSNDEDQDDQVWRDVEAETGFSSYRAYVESLVDSEERFGMLTYCLKNSNLIYKSGDIFVFDIRKDVTSFNFSDLVPPVTHRSSLGSQMGIRSKMSTRLLQTLRSPPEDIPARILLWSLPLETAPHASIIDALGLSLDIHPSFFENLYQPTSYRSTLLPTRSHQIVIGDTISTVARDYRRERHVPPVLVIAGRFDLYCGFSSFDEKPDEAYHRILKEVINQEIGGDISLFRSAIDRISAHDLGSVPSNHYLKLLGKYFDKDCYVDCEVDAILLIAVLPLLRLEILRLRSQCGMINSVLRAVHVGNPRLISDANQGMRYNQLDRHRFWLRRRLEGLQESRDTFHSFARSQNAANWLETETWLNQDADIRETLAMARTKELEVRDYMQLQIGNLSISESRKSIQLSNQQMNEAKKGKKSTQSSLRTSANRIKVKIRMEPIHTVSAFTLMSLSHHLGFNLRTYQSCHFCIRYEPPTAEPERSKRMVVRGDCISIFASHGGLLVFS